MTPPGLGVLISRMGVKAVPPSLMGVGGKETGSVLKALSKQGLRIVAL